MRGLTVCSTLQYPSRPPNPYRVQQYTPSGCGKLSKYLRDEEMRLKLIGSRISDRIARCRKYIILLFPLPNMCLSTQSSGPSLIISSSALLLHSFFIKPAEDLDGRIWKDDLKTGNGEVVVEEVGSPAIGLTFDKRSKYLYVCGGILGEPFDSFNRILRYCDAYSRHRFVVGTKSEVSGPLGLTDVLFTVENNYVTVRKKCCYRSGYCGCIEQPVRH